MTDLFKEFKGHEWLGRPIQLEGGALVLMQNTRFSAMAAAVQFGGRKADVYKGEHNGRVVAVKAFHRTFALEDNFFSTLVLRPLATLPGLTVCDRRVVNDREAAGAGATGLSWSVVMPWIDGDPWAEYIDEQRPITAAESVALARQTARVLASLENEDLVHTDISSGNVIVTQLGATPWVELIDVEDMFGPGFKTPQHVPDGTPGYAHPHNTGRGCWNRYGDRFAGAILLVEMLIWHDADVRAATGDGSLFEQDELCRHSDKFQLVRRVVRSHSDTAAALLDRVWTSDGLSDCPTLAQWDGALADATTPSVAEPVPEPFAIDFDRLLRFSHRLAEPRLQTSFVAAVTCDECGANITNGNPSDHLPTCSHHPFRIRWTGLLGASAPPKEKTTLAELTRGWWPGSELCPDCFRFVTGPFDPNHGPDCPAATPKPFRSVTKLDVPHFDDIEFRPLTSKPPARPHVCAECARFVFVGLDGTEQGHAPGCAG
jgi:hypothetical protein